MLMWSLGYLQHGSLCGSTSPSAGALSICTVLKASLWW